MSVCQVYYLSVTHSQYLTLTSSRRPPILAALMRGTRRQPRREVFVPTLYRPDTPLPADAAYAVVRQDGRGLHALTEGLARWQAASRITWGPAPYETSFAAFWNEYGLAVRFEASDHSPWHTMRRRDDSIYEEEVVEIFLDPGRAGRDYAEVEISPANVVTDLRICQPAPLQNDRGWDWVGLASFVRPAPGLPAGSWEALVWLPWDGLRGLAPGSVEVPPAPGARWRFNVFRIKRPHGPQDPERDAIYAAWSAPEGPTFHVPAAFRDLVFLP